MLATFPPICISFGLFSANIPKVWAIPLSKFCFWHFLEPFGYFWGHYLVALLIMKCFQNDMGLKPHDCAKLMGQKECAEFLILYEASLEMAKELSEVQHKREALMAEHNELRSFFKYVYTVQSHASSDMHISYLADGI